jgi:hypothetical protein
LALIELKQAYWERQQPPLAARLLLLIGLIKIPVLQRLVVERRLDANIGSTKFVAL